MPTRKKKSKPAARSGQPLNIRLPDDVMEALRELSERNLRTITTEVTLALKEYLGKQGVYKPKD